MTSRLRGDGRVGRNAIGGEACVVWESVEGSAVEGEGDLDLGLVGVAVYEGCAARRWYGHGGGNGLQGFIVLTSDIAGVLLGKNVGLE